MQDGSIRGEEASAWLKTHFADDPAPEIRVTWRVDASEEQPSDIYPLLDLLFGPP
jgi:hypothetical protein